ncbi:MAG TPA: hypothetical protein VGT99_12605 [Gammaproteobacteria bacterium]|nr:hypothetical protein [Gammaproteobacteria bacterium]
MKRGTAMMTADTHDRPAPGSGAWLPIMVLLGLAFAVAAGLYSSRMMVRPQPVAAPAIAAADSGTALDVVVEVTGSSAGDVTARLLDKRGDAYVRGADSLQLHLVPEVKFAMGNRGDLKPGAVLQVHGILESASRRLLDAEQVVFLTGYVKVE